MKRILACVLVLLSALTISAKDYTLSSPSGNISTVVRVDSTTTLSVIVKGVTVMQDCKVAMRLADSTVLGVNAKIRKDTRGSRTENISAPFYRQSAFQASYNYLSLRYDGNYTLQVRAYNDGIAYRFVTSFPETIEVVDETVQFNFTDAFESIIPWKLDVSADPYESSFENQYAFQKIGEYGENKDRLAFLPIVVRSEKWGNILLTESDVEDYPGMFVKLSDKGFKAVFPPIPTKYKTSGRGVERPVSYSNIIAKTSGSRSFPWRIIAYAESDSDLPVNNMVYQTASPSRIDEIEWITPGQSAWDWWNANLLYNVPFKAGINTDTYQHHIDFAAANGLKYVILDEGWYKDLNPLTTSDEVNVKYLCGYAQESNVKLLLWISSSLLFNNAEEICSHYADLGIGGFKVDFFDAQDQKTVNQIYELAEIAAKYHLVLDLHGMYKPTGLTRTFPNLLNFEGVFGLEQLKWTSADDADMPLNDVLIPYIRMAAGPVDYTPGAMRNARREEFRPIFSRPMSQGTRAHQIALYIVYDAPLVMLCDSPSAYEEDKATTDFITSIPTTFQNTTVLSGEIGKSIVTMREKDGVYYIGGLTNWNERDIDIPLDFLSEGTWKARIYKDGVNADVTATDHVIENINVDSSTSLELHMAPGGGFAIIIEK